MPRALKRILYVVAGSFAIVILIAIASPEITRDNYPRREMGAIGVIRTIHAAQVQYSSQYGRYATSLSELGPAGADLIDGELTSGRRYGFKFTMSGDGSYYVIHADPESFGKSGSRTFYSDQTMTIRQNWGQQPATINSPELK